MFREARRGAFLEVVPSGSGETSLATNATIACANGSLDTGFGSSGKVRLGPTIDPVHPEPRDVIQLANGKAIFTANSADGSTVIG